MLRWFLHFELPSINLECRLQNLQKQLKTKTETKFHSLTENRKLNENKWSRRPNSSAFWERVCHALLMAWQNETGRLNHPSANMRKLSCHLSAAEASRSICVKNPCYPDIHIVAAEIVKGQSLWYTLSLIVARPWLSANPKHFALQSVFISFNICPATVLLPFTTGQHCRDSIYLVLPCHRTPIVLTWPQYSSLCGVTSGRRPTIQSGCWARKTSDLIRITNKDKYD